MAWMIILSWALLPAFGRLRQLPKVACARTKAATGGEDPRPPPGSARCDEGGGQPLAADRHLLGKLLKLRQPLGRPPHRLEVHRLAELDQPHARSSREILDRFTPHQVRQQPLLSRWAADLRLHAHATPLPKNWEEYIGFC